MNKPDLKNCSTEELFEELESREGVLKFCPGPYQLYDIFPKYGAPPLVEAGARLRVVAVRVNESVKKRKQEVFHEHRERGTNERAEDRHSPVMPSVLRTLTSPLFLVSVALGVLLAHFVIGPLIFG